MGAKETIREKSALNLNEHLANNLTVYAHLSYWLNWWFYLNHPIHPCKGYRYSYLYRIPDSLWNLGLEANKLWIHYLYSISNYTVWPEYNESWTNPNSYEFLIWGFIIFWSDGIHYLLSEFTLKSSSVKVIHYGFSIFSEFRLHPLSLSWIFIESYSCFANILCFQ